MITVKSASHIRTRRNIKGFWSCQACTGSSTRHLDAGRMNQQEGAWPAESCADFGLFRSGANI
jgi:hypothetical protein